jgi:hypothetical protein
MVSLQNGGVNVIVQAWWPQFRKPTSTLPLATTWSGNWIMLIVTGALLSGVWSNETLRTVNMRGVA